MVALAKSAAQSLHHLRFPNESDVYREARNALLDEEMKLRRQIERVAALRRALPVGGDLTSDYVFEEAGRTGPARQGEAVGAVCPAQGHPRDLQLHVRPERERPCPGCTHFLDSLDGAVRHTRERFNFAVVAKSPLPRILAFAQERGWRHLRLLSTAGNRYDRDYFGDSTALTPGLRQQQDFKSDEQWDMPMLNVFRRIGNTIHHFWGCELLYVPPEPGQEYRHNDLLDPVWNMFDVLPQGRGDFQPKLDYA